MKSISLTNTLRTLAVLAIFSTSSFVCANTNTDTNILSLSNLERERSALIADMLDLSLSFDQRHEKLSKRQRQLTDMERMVMRDERLLSSTNFAVKRAFNEYELTFLVHAGAENQQSASAQWLDMIDFDSASVLNAKVGRR
ncbi:hypothetical protein PN836_001810 [Ningiella sp. W23]|uniref:hypothetical protein n=1 Tax=Ningiella sp. W23 TaxID=3023715 RepID=UPI0037576353